MSTAHRADQLSRWATLSPAEHLEILQEAGISAEHLVYPSALSPESRAAMEAGSENPLRDDAPLIIGMENTRRFVEYTRRIQQAARPRTYYLVGYEMFLKHGPRRLESLGHMSHPMIADEEVTSLEHMGRLVHRHGTGGVARKRRADFVVKMNFALELSPQAFAEIDATIKHNATPGEEQNHPFYRLPRPSGSQ